jgi:hypothetical protein
MLRDYLYTLQVSLINDIPLRKMIETIQYVLYSLETSSNLSVNTKPFIGKFFQGFVCCFFTVLCIDCSSFLFFAFAFFISLVYDRCNWC